MAERDREGGGGLLGTMVLDLKAAYSAGDSDRQNEVLKARMGELLTLIGRMFPDLQPNDRDDFLQDVFLKVLPSIGKLTATEPQRAFAWLYRIIKNYFNDILRRRNRHRETLPAALPDADEGSWAESREESPEARAERKEEEERLKAAVAALPCGVREAIEATYEEGKSRSDGATLCRIPRSTFHSRVERGRDLLRRELSCPSRPPAPPGVLPLKDLKSEES
ncbi:MAG: RNA polymerase sigma factor [Planctomycetes bacterium]|nr:RNA polymerase sigma factor [Planctomycetota bacterium]